MTEADCLLLTELDCSVGHRRCQTPWGHIREYDHTTLKLNHVVALAPGQKMR